MRVKELIEKLQSLKGLEDAQVHLVIYNPPAERFSTGDFEIKIFARNNRVSPYIPAHILLTGDTQT